MDSRYITLLNLVKTKSYTKTAELLYVSQPTVTHHIKSLEQEFNCKIFEYDNKELKLTYKGKLIKDFVEKISVMYKDFETEIEAVDSEYKIYNLGTSNNITSYYLLDIVEHIYKDLNRIKLNILIKDNQKLIESLDSGKVDFIITDKFFDQTKYEKILLEKSEYCLVCGKNNPLRFKKNVLFQDLLDQVLYINPKNELLIQNLKLRYYTLENLKNSIIIENYPIIKKLVMNDLGISFIARELITNEIENGELFVIDFKDFTIDKEIYFVYNKTSLKEEQYYKIYNNFLYIKNKNKKNVNS